jgi:hypothetical protein
MFMVRSRYKADFFVMMETIVRGGNPGQGRNHHVQSHIVRRIKLGFSNIFQSLTSPPSPEEFDLSGQI